VNKSAVFISNEGTVVADQLPYSDFTAGLTRIS